MSKTQKWKRLAARFAAEKANLSPHEVRQAERRAITSEIIEPKLWEYKLSTLPPEFPLPIPVEAALKLEWLELSGGDEYLPKYQDILKFFINGETLANKFISNWFFHGLSDEQSQRLSVKVGINPQAAMRIIRYTMVSQSSEHNHKMAGCAYLLQAWFQIT